MLGNVLQGHPVLLILPIQAISPFGEVTVTGDIQCNILQDCKQYQTGHMQGNDLHGYRTQSY